MTDTALHKQLRNVVAEQLRGAILEGRYKPGEWLRQERLAQDLGVSQMPVREALKELTAEGLIEHVPYRGARVISFSLEDVEDLYAHRAYLESRAAFFAAERVTPEELDDLRALQSKIEAHNAPELVAKYRALNREFHRKIYSACRREYLIRALNQMWASFPTMLIANFAGTFNQPLPERDPADAQEHRALLAALESRDPEAAAQAMSAHILNAAGHFVRFLKS